MVGIFLLFFKHVACNFNATYFWIYVMYMFQNIEEEMERDDVVTLIKELIVYKWNIFCKSSSIS